MTLTTAAGKVCEGIDQGPFEPIAIIGASALMPDADSIEQFWQNIIDAKVSIKEIDPARWGGDISSWWKEGGPGKSTEGFTYAKIGAFVEGFEFDWKRWRQPPGTLPQIDPCQLWAISVAADVLDDAGYGTDGRELDKSRCGVVFANALGGENRNLSNIRVWSEHTLSVAKKFGLPTENSEQFIADLVEGTPRINEDTMPGELANVVAGRVANLLDLQGPNHAMDAACASSLAAIMDACRLLQTRQVDTMICGATDRTMDPATFSKFSAIGALSPSHSTPFDSGANGFVMGEGAGALLLKRLSDAIRDGDEVKAVIRGVGASSDGRGKGITAPSQRGQVQAIGRAYSQAGYDANSVQLVEAHGTSTKVGDATELSTLGRLWNNLEAGDKVAVGSIKSQIGHLKAAAGIAGVLKASYALHHRTIPPSAGFVNPNPTVEWDENPFFVPTQALEWPAPEGHPRRAGVSAFGFGGTNFHVALEGFDPEYHASISNMWDERWAAYSGKGSAVIPDADSILDKSAIPVYSHEEMKAIEGGVLLLSGASISDVKSKLESISFSGTNFDDSPSGSRLSSELPKKSTEFSASDAVRMALVATSWAEFEKRKALALKAMEDKAKWGFLMAQMVLVTDEPALPSAAKVAHMYPGQGSQYVGMTFDLWKRYSAVQKVWSAADETMTEVLEGETLSGFVLRDNLSKEEMVEASHKLKQTEYTQPAMLTADLALEKSFNDHGLFPDMVAGHSLGEYAALMASGIMDMDSALRAAAARGTEMGSVEIDDNGLMASVTAPYEEVAEVIESIDGYVIAANKNSPKMTVIAGSTPAVKDAMSVFEEKGFNCVVLPTSHAFHSEIVAPANAPLKKFLEELDLKYPKIPITSNVDGQFYPMSGDSSSDAILEKLAPQMASSVEWTTQINTMYDAGARIFVEVGPKRALSVFATQILEDRPHLAVMANHPKQGGIATFLAAIASMALAGRDMKMPESTSEAYSEGFRAGPLEAYEVGLSESKSTSELEDLRVNARPLPSKGGSVNVVQTITSPTKPVDPEVALAKAKDAYVGDRLASLSGYPARFCNGAVNLRLGLGLSEDKIASAMKTIHAECAVDPEYDVSGAQTAADLIRWVNKPPSNWSPMTSSTRIATSDSSTNAVMREDTRKSDPFVVTGVSLGLPGEKVFSDDNFEKLIRGETCISEVSDEYKQRLLDKNITRLIKGRDGSVNMDQAKEFGDIPQLAGTMGAFDLAEEFGVDPKVIMAWDITTQLAVASGLLALRDAAIPLTPEEQVGKGGLRLIRSWQVPAHQRDRTGVIFASCFPGTSMSFDHAKANGDDGEGKFDRRFLFQVLNMGHSQFAQHVGIRGPNTTVNVACASSTNAFSIAEDWLANDRADRVVIISADNVTGDSLWEWIGSGFAASGAASTSNVVEEAALPFDARRDGLILGMGAASFVIERNSEAQQRGVQPYAEILSTKLANSAFHGTRLDVEHVAETFDSFISEAEQQWGLDRHKMAGETVFFSHETYTPARGGSAQAEVKALRDTFGKSADSLIISNTKGFTGHPMGVGIEDASMIYGLHHGKIPPIANHKVVDEELGNLNLSKGGAYPNLKYGIRFGAGFGSQIALSLLRKWPVVGERIDAKKFLAWNQDLANTSDVRLRILQNKLVAYVDGDENLHGGVQGEKWHLTADIEGQDLRSKASPPEPSSAPQPRAVEPVPQAQPVANPAKASVSVSTSMDTEEIRKVVLDVVVKHTGYPADFVEFDQDLEGELGIDTVKQAEIMADIRGKFNLPVDEDFILADYPTLEHMMGYIVKMQGGEVTISSAEPSEVPAPAPAQPASQTESPVVEKTQTQQSSAVKIDDEELRSTVLKVVVEHTGYPEDFIEFDQDLEGELGIDTVKQAEIMGDIRAKFSLPVDEDFVLADYPTLDHMMGYIVKMKGGDVASSEAVQQAPAPTPVAPQSPASASPVEAVAPSKSEAPLSAGSEEIQSAVVSIVVKHTGYPEDFIEMDQDLEGELGIDTVKQAEIMGDVREHFSLPLDEDFILSDHPTLNHFVSYIVNMKGGNDKSTSDASQEVATDNAIETNSESMDVQECRRWQVEVEESQGEPAVLGLQSGTVVVSIDDWGISEAMVSKLKSRGLDVVKVGFEQGMRGDSKQEENGVTVYRADPAKPDHIAEICSQMSDLDIVGAIHLSALKLAGADWHSESTPSSQIALAAHGWFGLLKGLDSKFAKAENGFVASVTSMDGRHGNLSSNFNALQCAASGVTKSYGGERPELRVRAFDVHPELILDADKIAETIVEDIFTLGGDMEIGLDVDGTRWTLVCFAEDIVDEIQPLQSDDVWMVSGGGSGITAASIIGVAQASKDAKATFLLLGRTRLIPATKEWLDWTDEQLNDEKMALRERMMTASSTGKVTMVDWNRAFDKMLRSRDVYQTIASIEATGNLAEYHSADVTDVAKLSEIGKSIGKQITGLVHGAGMEDSKLVADKKNEIFDLTVRIKVDGWKAMLEAVKSSGDGDLRFAACFTSVAGRFGNIGQTDYAAANSVLDAEMARLTASGKTRAVAIGWTGWQDVGMATRGSIQAVFDASGIMTIPKDLGVDIFVKEALAGGKRRVIGCGSLGIMDKFNSFREAPLKLPDEMSAVIADPRRFPFIDKVVELDARNSLTSQTMLSVKLHPFLKDHAIDGVPYHPGVMALEMFAQNALLLRPDCAFAGFEEVKFGLPVKLMKSEMITRVKVEVKSESDGVVHVTAKLVSDLMNSKGQVFGEREHHEAVVRLVEKSEDLTAFLQSEVSSLPEIGTPSKGELIHSPSFIYLRYFHGPRFQSHGGVLRGVGDDQSPGVDGIALMRHQLPAIDQFELESEGEEVLLEALPMLIEAGFQNAGLVAMETEGFSSLPVGIEWSSSLRVPDADETLRLRSVKTATEDAGVTVHDVVIVGDDDAPVLSLKGLRLKAMAPVDEDQAFTLERN